MARPRVQAPAPQLMERFEQTHQGPRADGVTFNLVYGLPQPLFWCKSSSMVSGPYLLYSFLGRFAVHRPGQCRGKRHFGVTHFPFQPNEDVLESPRPLTLIPFSGAGYPGHLNRFYGHFQRSFDRRCRPRSCAGSDSDGWVLQQFIDHWLTGL